MIRDRLKDSRCPMFAGASRVKTSSVRLELGRDIRYGKNND